MTTSQTVPTVPRLDAFDRKTIGLTADFIEAAFDDATILAGILYGSLLVLLPEDDPAFVDESIARGIEAVRQGRDVVFRHLVPASDSANPS
ncbi:MAG: hypothetical protein QOF33_3890 [Thermomicrobiales bacterium]|jgi:hypothetical protein|nr:hypothetical protein [Thermomicrobiales bacterium]